MVPKETQALPFHKSAFVVVSHPLLFGAICRPFIALPSAPDMTRHHHDLPVRIHVSLLRKSRRSRTSQQPGAHKGLFHGKGV